MGMDLEDMHQHETVSVTSGDTIKFTMLPKIHIEDTTSDKRSLLSEDEVISVDDSQSVDRPIFTLQSDTDQESDTDDSFQNHINVTTQISNGGTQLTINNNAIKPEEQSPKRNRESRDTTLNIPTLTVQQSNLLSPAVDKPKTESRSWRSIIAGKFLSGRNESVETSFLTAPKVAKKSDSMFRPHSVDNLPQTVEYEAAKSNDHLSHPFRPPLLQLSGKTLSVDNNSSGPRKFSMPVHLNRSSEMEMDGINRVNSHSTADLNHTWYNAASGEVNDGLKRPSHEFRIKDQLFSFFQASDNKLAMKLFGSKTALMKEKRRQLVAHTWIIHPCSNFRLYWDLLMLIFLFTNLVVLPIAIAFFFDDIGTHWLVFNITCDSVFIIDIVINFRTGLIDKKSHGAVILDKKIIALRYLKSWFFVDLISSLPFDYIFLTVKGQGYSAGIALRILRLAKVLQLLRLLRISRLVRYVRIWQEFFSLATIVVRIFNLVCIMAMISHWSGCIQFFVPVIQGWPEDSWISMEGLQKRSWPEQYTTSLFKALSHMLCIGYGQYPPRNMTDTWLTILSMLMGATCYALFVGHATTLIQSFDTSSRQFRDHGKPTYHNEATTSHSTNAEVSEL